MDSIDWRHHWEVSKDDVLKQKLLRYNLDDCEALKILTDTLMTILTSGTENQDSVIAASSIPIASPYKLGPTSFVMPEFAYINGGEVLVQFTDAVEREMIGLSQSQDEPDPIEVVRVDVLLFRPREGYHRPFAFAASHEALQTEAMLVACANARPHPLIVRFKELLRLLKDFGGNDGHVLTWEFEPGSLVGRHNQRSGRNRPDGPAAHHPHGGSVNAGSAFCHHLYRSQ